MLNNKLQIFLQKVNEAVAIHGLNAKAVTDAVIVEAFPETISAAIDEGADSMLRNGVIDFLSSHFKRVPAHHPFQLSLDIPESVRPIVAKLKGEAHYVKKLGRYVPNAILISNRSWLNDARNYKRAKGNEVLAEAQLLDEIYVALYRGKDAPNHD